MLVSMMLILKKLINSYIKNLLQQKSNQNKKFDFFFFWIPITHQKVVTMATGDPV